MTYKDRSLKKLIDPAQHYGVGPAKTKKILDEYWDLYASMVRRIEHSDPFVHLTLPPDTRSGVAITSDRIRAWGYEKEVHCTNHTPIPLGSKSGFCKTCDCDMILNADLQWEGQ